ncbi:MAG: IS200/IS605 family transposase [Bacteroidota bacterium]
MEEITELRVTSDDRILAHGFSRGLLCGNNIDSTHDVPRLKPWAVLRKQYRFNPRRPTTSHGSRSIEKCSVSRFRWCASHSGVSHSRPRLCYHIVFSTKHRNPYISQEIERDVWGILWDTCIEHGIHPYAIGGVEDHIHVLASIPPHMTVIEALRLIKGASSREMRRRFPSLSNFSWQTGYSIMTFDHRVLPRLVAYVKRQRQHHSKKR